MAQKWSTTLSPCVSSVDISGAPEKMPSFRTALFFSREKSDGPKVAHWLVIFRVSRPHCWKQLAEPWIPYANKRGRRILANSAFLRFGKRYIIILKQLMIPFLWPVSMMIWWVFSIPFPKLVCLMPYINFWINECWLMKNNLTMIAIRWLFQWTFLLEETLHSLPTLEPSNELPSRLNVCMSGTCLRLRSPIWHIFSALGCFWRSVTGFWCQYTGSNCTISPARHSSNSGLCFCGISPPQTERIQEPGSLTSKIFLPSGCGICKPFPAGSPVCTERV